ncbi:short-chain dehydrogenase, partial [Pseudomonas sp. MWU12-2534b]
MTDHSLNNKVVLIAGGVKNLGGLIARDLASHGARAVAVHYNSDASQADAQSTLEALKALGVEAHAWPAARPRAGAGERLCREVKARFGKIDIAINTVGKVLKKPIIEIS